MYPNFDRKWKGGTTKKKKYSDNDELEVDLTAPMKKFTLSWFQFWISSLFAIHHLIVFL